MKKYVYDLNCVSYVKQVNKQIILQYKPCLTFETRCKACQLVIFGWLLCGCQGVAKQLVEHSGWLLEHCQVAAKVLLWCSKLVVSAVPGCYWIIFGSLISGW